MAEYLVSDEDKEIIIEEVDEELDFLVTYKGKQYCGHKIIIESEEDVDITLIQNLVSRLSELCDLKHECLVGISKIVFSGSQEAEGIVPIMILCPVESKLFKTLNQTAYSLDQLMLAKTLTDIASLLKTLHSKSFYHGSINADLIYFDEISKSYCLHPIGIVKSLVVQLSAMTTPASSQVFFNCERSDVFQFANLFRKMFLDYPSISSLLSCSISYILEDCLNEEPANRPSSTRVSDALNGIMIGFNSMQLEIERLKKLLASTTAAANQSKITGASSNQTSSPQAQKPGGARQFNGSRAVPIQAMQEKRANVGSFDRTLQIFKSKLHQVRFAIPRCEN